MKSVVIFIIILVIIIGGTYFIFGEKSELVKENIPTGEVKENQNNMENNIKALIRTNMGNIELEFFTADAPETVSNFIKLSEAGFYNGTKFHRVMKDFMIQGGDPLTKDDSRKENWGTGGPGYKFADEIHSNNKNITGTIAMANSGPDTNGSQFFINTMNNNYLDAKHTVFGKVVSGMDVVAKIEETPTTEEDRPNL